MLLKKTFQKKINSFFITVFTVFLLFSCSKNIIVTKNIDSITNVIEVSTSIDSVDIEIAIDEDSTYTSKDEVALYIKTFKKLPKNFITKNEAKKLGWNILKNYVGDVAKGKSIGGDRYSNYEKRLPDIKGRKYIECDIDYKGKKRNAKRIIYADDFDESVGYIFYTEDHYKTFEKLY